MARSKKDTPSKNEKPVSDEDPTEMVRMAAYYHWEKRGKPSGEEWHDWLEAEKEIKNWMKSAGMLPPDKPKNK